MLAYRKVSRDRSELPGAVRHAGREERGQGCVNNVLSAQRCLLRGRCQAGGCDSAESLNR